MISLKSHYGYLILVFAALASWLLVNLSDLGISNNRAIQPHSPDFFSNGYIKWEMNASGLVNTQLFADKIIHYSDDRTTDLDKPLISFHQNQQPPWIIKSESGKVSADGKNVMLHGRVVIDRDKFGNVRPLRINTSNLKVMPETHYAETDEKAELISLPNKTTGTGMKLVFKQPIRIELLAHVQGKYETKP